MRKVHWFSLSIAGLWLVSAAAVFGDPTKSSEPVAAKRPEDGKLRVVVFGAHPDDAEIRAGGAAMLWSAQGHRVEMVSVTNGDIGHTRMAGGPLAQRRLAEVRAASKVLGTTAQVLDIHDGELLPTLENRRLITRVIRQWNADLVIAHRPNDYHPDHRYVGVLIQDAAFMVTVPFFCPDTPYLQANPVFLYSYDAFQKPAPFRPDIAVSIDSVIEKKLDALLLLESQFVEGGANSYRDPFPNTPAEREACAKKSRAMFAKRFADIADRCRDKLVELYGEEQGKKVRYAEAFEICEYGRRPTADDIRRLFPFLPQKK
jgi:LmbE family N-acetylglucosaminyl deacetylase